jgi:hypothetical protein
VRLVQGGSCNEVTRMILYDSTFLIDVPDDPSQLRVRVECGYPSPLASTSPPAGDFRRAPNRASFDPKLPLPPICDMALIMFHLQTNDKANMTC